MARAEGVALPSLPLWCGHSRLGRRSQARRNRSFPHGL